MSWNLNFSFLEDICISYQLIIDSIIDTIKYILIHWLRYKLCSANFADSTRSNVIPPFQFDLMNHLNWTLLSLEALDIFSTFIYHMKKRRRKKQEKWKLDMNILWTVLKVFSCLEISASLTPSVSCLSPDFFQIWKNSLCKADNLFCSKDSANDEWINEYKDSNYFCSHDSASATATPKIDE